MGQFDAIGGLAALRTQLLGSGSETGSSYSAANQSTPPRLSPLQTDFRPRSDTAAQDPNTTSSDQRTSSASNSSLSAHSRPSTAFTSPNASLDAKQPWQSRPDRSSAASSSRGSTSAFAYSDQLNSPDPGMYGRFAGPSMSSGSTAGPSSDVSGSSHLQDITPTELASPEHSRGFGRMTSRGDDGDESEDSPLKDRSRQKKANPLQDLIETETAFVVELSKIIRKVASAWSRTNFPPPELDTMFRNVEAIYRVNRTFLKSLKDIGPEPSSPRALGDLLMRWIDDLEAPYERYCDNYFVDFDTWPAVQGNTKLAGLLAEISPSTNEDGSPVVYSDKKRQAGETWTLDQLFILPQTRLRYYKKLYARLLKSTHAGRSDHRLLLGANEKLDELLEKSKKRISMSLLDDAPMAAQERAAREVAAIANGSYDTSISATSSSSGHQSRGKASEPNAFLSDKLGKLDFSGTALADALNAPPSPLPSGESPLTPIIPGQRAQPPPLMGSASAVPAPLSGDDVSIPQTNGTLSPADDLERLTDMSRVLDLFTMKPKKCQLRINPPTLPFKRGMRKRADAVIDFTPLSTGAPLTWRRGHIILLTDLFLVCESMTPIEQQEQNMGPDAMWLLFPPLAGKHLRVSDGPGNSLDITILKKETLTVQVSSTEEKEQWKRAFQDCNDFATNMGLKIATSNPSTMKSLPAPILSPLIAVTPSPSNDGSVGLGLADGSRAISPATTVGREQSWNSTSSFPKVKGGNFPGDNRDGRLAMPASNAPTRSPSPSQGMGFGTNSRLSPSSDAGMNDGRPQGSFSSDGRASPGISSNLRPMQNNGGPPRIGLNVLSTSPSSVASPPTSSRPAYPLGLQQQQQQGGPMRRPMHPPGGPGPQFSRAPSPNPNQQRPFVNGGGPPPSSYPMPPRMPPIPPSESDNPQADRNRRPREPSRRPSAPNLREQHSEAVTPPVRTRSASSVGSNGGLKKPSEMMKDGDLKSHTADDYSPPSSPKLGPTTSTVSAQMRCRLYLKQSHAQWKALGNARLKLYHLMPANERQLVVENDRKTMISTIVLSDGVERVGKVGVAVEISDQGNRTGIIYMLQLRSEESAQGLFGELIADSGRTIAIT